MSEYELQVEFEQVCGTGLDRSKWRRLDNGAWVHTTAIVDATARVGAGARVGDDARVGAGASVGATTDCITVGPLGSRGAMLTGVKHNGTLMIGTGCFWGTPEEFEAKVKETNGDNEHAKHYAEALLFLRAWAGGAK